MQIELSLLGPFRVRVAQAELAASVWKLRHPRMLLQMLALAPGHELHRDLVLERLWPRADVEAASNRLYHTLHLLRGIFAKAGVPKCEPVVEFQGGQMALNPVHEFVVDVRRFGELIQQARCADAAAQAPLSQAIELYRGELLGASPYEDWLVAQREECRLACGWALDRLAALRRSAGQPEQAVALYQKLVQIEPANELAHRALMQLFEEAGHPERAVYQYTACKRYLQRDLDAEPSPQTQALLERIVAQSRQSKAQAAPPVQPVRMRYSAPPHAIALLGREADLATLQGWMTGEGARLVTITGTAGLGKTRLAHALAERVQDQYADGVAAVALTSLSNPVQLADHLAAALGLAGQGEHSPTRLQQHLRSRRMLLVLDRFEHILDAAALVAELLNAAPGLTVLATSQAPLRIAAERLYELPSLTQREPQAAVQLFCTVARNLNVHIEQPEQLGSVQLICTRLGGNALAIELAAAQTPVLALPQVLAQLDRPLELLTSPTGDVENHQGSLREAIAWSWGLLDPAIGHVFAMLGVFPAAFTLDDAVAVLGGLCAPRALHAAVRALLDRHMISREPQPCAQTQTVRFVMFDALQQFARQHAQATAQWELAQATHARHFANKVNHCFDALRSGTDAGAMRASQRFLADTRQAVRWHAQHADTACFLQLVHASGTLEFYATGGTTVLAQLEAALGSRSLVTPQERRQGAWCRYLLARVHAWQAQHRRSIHAIRVARQLARGLGDERLDDKIESHFALQRMHQLRFALVRYHLERRIRRDASQRDTAGLAKAFCTLSFVHATEGDYAAAVDAADEGLSHALRAGSLPLTILAHYRVALLALCFGNAGRARALLEPCLLLAEQAGVVPLYMLRTFDAVVHLHAVELEPAGAKLIELQQHAIARKNQRVRFGLAITGDFVAIEDDRFDDVRTLDKIDAAAFAFDATTAELYLGLWLYKLRLHARRGEWRPAYQCVEQLCGLLRRTRNGLWYAWLCDACCHALIDRGELRTCRRLLAHSRRFMKTAGLQAAPLQARNWERIDAAVQAGLGKGSTHNYAPKAWSEASPQALQLLLACMQRSFFGEVHTAEPVAALAA